MRKKLTNKAKNVVSKVLKIKSKIKSKGRSGKLVKILTLTVSTVCFSNASPSNAVDIVNVTASSREAAKLILASSMQQPQDVLPTLIDLLHIISSCKACILVKEGIKEGIVLKLKCVGCGLVTGVTIMR